MGFLLGNSKTAKDDLPLFEKLGFEPFEIDNRNKVFLGEYKLPDHDKAVIKVWVTCLPAQFWDFEIFSEEGDTFKCSTGSGKLSEYWESVKLIAESMLVVEKLNNEIKIQELK